jgi:large subunit ribosomal protein L9
MKVILLKDVPRIGRKFEVKDVPDGHALNFLIPRRLAERATADVLKRLDVQKSKHALEVAETEQAFEAALATAKDAGVTVTAEANDEGHLYRAVHADDIVEAFKLKGIEIEERAIVIDTPIKSLGAHHITISANGREGQATIEVVRK